jgi:hypothetical protein
VERETPRMSLFALVCLVVSLPSIALAATPSCGAPHLSSRSPTAWSGSEFARRASTMSEAERDQAIESELLAGNMPAFLKRFTPVTLSGESSQGVPVKVVVCVAPDYLAIGSDSDYMLAPMRIATALRIASRYHATLPTSKMVDAIYAQAAVHLSPQPLPAGDQMRSTDYYWRHNRLIREQRLALGILPGVLTSGHKKDLVITNRLWQMPERVAIYGWHRASYQPIQPLSTVHGARYADYSHGVRLVSTEVYVNGQPRSIFDVLRDPQLASVLSAEGPIARVPELVAALSVRPPERVASGAHETIARSIATAY